MEIQEKMSDKEEINKNSILESLQLSTTTENNEENGENSKLMPCLFCDFAIIGDDREILHHLYIEHRLIISDAQDITNICKYLKYWKEEFKGFEPEEYCTTMLWKQLPDGTKTEHDEKYFLLSDIVPKDRKIRQDIQIQWIQDALSRHQFERTDKNYTKGCLFCRDEIESTRFHYIDHLYSKHFFNLGRFETLVYVDELIDLVEEKMKNLICVYCEKVFKDRGVLKEHMRKKGHKLINPDNKSYDKFYLCNYRMKENPLKDQQNQAKLQIPNLPMTRRKRKVGKTKEKQQRDLSEEPSTTIFNRSDESSDWSDWENDQEIEIICLFCQQKDKNFENLTTHMTQIHKFDFHETTKNFNFYQKVKLINFIRRKVHLKQCLSCQLNFQSNDELISHMEHENHIQCNEQDFEKPEFFFPTFEDDAFLCNLDNIKENEEMSDDSGAHVIAEDPIALVNEAAEMLSKERFVDL